MRTNFVEPPPPIFCANATKPKRQDFASRCIPILWTPWCNVASYKCYMIRLREPCLPAVSILMSGVYP